MHLEDETAGEILALAPFVTARPPGERFGLALRALIDGERMRRGMPDPTGALHVSFLTQGALLRGEYDLAVHAHTGWEVGALTVDVRGMIHVNQEAGFPAGDRFLRAVVAALKATFPRSPVVRVHTDAFAVLFPPSADELPTPEHRTAALDALGTAAAGVWAELGRTARPVEFTVSLLGLRILDPSHWQVLGPLLWAEIERAHVLERAGKADGVQRRALDLAGRV